MLTRGSRDEELDGRWPEMRKMMEAAALWGGRGRARIIGVPGTPASESRPDHDQETWHTTRN